jgi:hypothetical protein
MLRRSTDRARRHADLFRHSLEFNIQDELRFRAGAMERMNQLSVVVRFHEGANINLLKRALYCLLDEVTISREVIVMVQFTNEAVLAEVSDICERLFVTGCCRVAGISVAPGEDRRGELLATGVALAEGRYLAFLDYDDMLFLTGVSKSVALCEAEGADLAIAQSLVAFVEGVFPEDFIVAKERFVRKPPKNPFALLLLNFAPLCAFVVSRAFLLRTGINFSSKLARLEDYEFLLRVLAAGKITLSPLATDVVNGQYNLNVDVGGTTLAKDLSPDVGVRQRERTMWEAARGGVRATIQSLTLGMNLLAIKDLLEAAANGEMKEMCLNLPAFVCRVRDGRTST